MTQPDLSVRALTESGEVETDADIVWTGEGLLSSNGSNQVLSSFTLTGDARSFVLRVKNSGNIAATFGLSLPAPPAGWTVRLFDSLEGGTDITSAVQGAQGWTLPSLAAGATKELRLEVTSSAAALASYEAKPRVAGSSLVDVVSIQNTLQKIAKIQWSDGGDEWHDFTGNLTITQNRVVGFRAIAADSVLGWNAAPTFKPLWQVEGETYLGEQTWIQFSSVGTWTLTAEGGNQKTATIEVQNDPQ